VHWSQQRRESTLINPKELKDISMEKLADDNFAVWKNIVQTEFAYYRILPTINGTHRPPSPNETLQFQYWESISQLFEMKFARTLPIEIWEAINEMVAKEGNPQAVPARR
jgi:hypothetical protein